MRVFFIWTRIDWIRISRTSLNEADTEFLIHPSGLLFDNDQLSRMFYSTCDQLLYFAQPLNEGSMWNEVGDMKVSIHLFVHVGEPSLPFHAIYQEFTRITQLLEARTNQSRRRTQHNILCNSKKNKMSGPCPAKPYPLYQNNGMQVCLFLVSIKGMKYQII